MSEDLIHAESKNYDSINDEEIRRFMHSTHLLSDDEGFSKTICRHGNVS